jgi:large subunit ribosomal protein L14e
MSIFEVGRICLKIAGRDAGRKCVVVESGDNFVVVDGGVRRKKVNVKHLEPTPQVIELKSGAAHGTVQTAFEKLGLPVWEKKSKKVTSRPRKQKSKKDKKVAEKPKKELKKEKKAEPKVEEKPVAEVKEEPKQEEQPVETAEEKPVEEKAEPVKEEPQVEEKPQEEKKQSTEDAVASLVQKARDLENKN